MNLNQVTVPSTNIARSVSFYQKLGLSLIVSVEHYARFECPDGTSTFSIHLTENTPDSSGISVYFESDQLDDLVKDLVSKGIEFDELPNDKPWLWREAYLKDPDGNQLILYHAGENRKNPPWRIN